VGPFHAEDAIGLDAAERIGAEIERRVIPSADALADWPLVRLNDAGMTRVLHGNPIGPQHLAGASFQAGTGAPHVRIVAPDGRLVAIATSRDGALHPVVVLG
jgi:tRNA U55 pseudouridine synthase TruB